MPALSASRACTAALVLILAGGAASAAVAGPAPVPPAHVDKDKAKDDRGRAETRDAGRGDDDNDKGKGKGPTPAPAPTKPAPARVPSAALTSAAPSSTLPGPGAGTSAPGAVADVTAPLAQVGVSVGLAPVSGTVIIRAADGSLQPVSALASLPTGTHVDTRAGVVAVTSAVDAAGTTQTGHFSGSIFEVRQAPGGRGVTQLVLLGGKWGACNPTTASTRGAVAHTARKKKPVRSLWGSDDHGRFQTRGRGSVATVRGTKWLTEDFCDGTRTTVAEGAVAVRDLAKGRTVVVKAGHSYFARAPKR